MALLLMTEAEEIVTFYLVFFGVLIILLILLRAGIKVVRQAEVMILERLGRLDDLKFLFLSVLYLYTKDTRRP